MDSECSLPGQLASVERNIVFLQQEHVTLLQGLHLEVLALQKRCTELACELSLKSPGKNQIELQEEVELLEARCGVAEVGVAEKQCTLGELRQELGHKGAAVGALRATLKEKERHFLEELKRRSHRSTLLNSELQKQTEVAAFLSFQLHAARQKLHHQRMQAHGQRQQSLARGRGAPGGAGGGGGHARSVSPQCPSLACATSPVVKPKRRGAARPFPGPVRLERARECVPRETVTGPAEPTAMPDPALFLHPRRHRARSRRPPAQRRPPPGRAEVEEGGGEALVEARDEEPRRAASLAPPAAHTEQQLM